MNFEGMGFERDEHVDVKLPPIAQFSEVRSPTTGRLQKLHLRFVDGVVLHIDIARTTEYGRDD